MEVIIATVVGLALGAVATALFLVLRQQRQRSQLSLVAAQVEAERGMLRQQLAEERERSAKTERMRDELREAHDHLRREEARLRQQLSDQERHHQDNLRLLNEAKAQMSEQFKALSAEVLQQNSQHLAAQHGERLGHLLKPFDERLQAFQQQIRASYDTEVRERISLRDELKRLAEQGERMTHEADGLARALKGESKTRGDWGEVILERVLEQSGLRRDQEYRLQVTQHTEDQRRLQPDVVIDLPDGKHLVIDSKLSLISWMGVCQAEDDDQRVIAERALVASVKNHVRGLSGKAYEQLFGLSSVDFVLCFIPLEAAFAVAVNADPDLYREAMERNVILVSPTTLLATMRTVAMTWRSERQERNALKIAHEAGKMYDQLVAYTESLDSLGQRLSQAQISYEQARKRLSEGRGNLIRRAEGVRLLGARAAKRLGQGYRDDQELDGDDLAEADGDDDMATDAHPRLDP